MMFSLIRGTEEFFDEQRHSQWSLAIIDFKLSDSFKELDYLHNSVHRAALTHDLKMPNTFKQRPKQHPKTKDGDDETKKNETQDGDEGGKKKENEGAIFVPFTHAELISYEAKLHEKATK